MYAIELKRFAYSGLLLFTIFLFFSATSRAQYFAQGPLNFSELPADSVIRIDPRVSRYQFEPNQLLVKFKDEAEISVSKQNGFAKTGLSSVDAILDSYQVTDAEKLIMGAKRLLEKEILTAPNGTQFERPSLHNIYLLRTNTESIQLFELIQALKEDPLVIYAEPNYIYSLVESEPLSPDLSEEEMLQWLEENNISKPGIKEGEGLVPNDPLYSQQWGIPATQVDQVWNTTTGSSNQIIAILDTGVDWNHPDLAENIWTNPGEFLNGADSDGNGFIDDIRGWDFINQDNNPMDDNSHGTHVAGIAAAKGNNGIGIAGVNWNAMILPVKVFQSSGYGDAATIAQGVNYAVNKGATVLNMSFGSYAESLTLKDALANAYATSVLVAAAGNDAKSIGPCSTCAPFFPAAYSFVLGIEANKAAPAPCGTNDPIIRACFSNFDPDGPVYSEWPDLYNYELKGPGVSTLSTIPGGNYRLYSGTSMAAPLVAGAVSIYLHQKPTDSKELLFGNFIQSSGLHFDLFAALNIQAQPNLDIISYELTDTVAGDGDGRPDAGEILDIYVKVRNSWDQANEVSVGIELGEFEDPSLVQVLQGEAIVGSISAYASRVNVNPLQIKISEQTANNRDIVLNLKTWYNENEGLKHQQIILKIENGRELSGVISKDSVLTAGKLWLVNSSLRIGTGVTLTLEPGAHLQINAGVDNRGTIQAIGLPNNRIKMEGVINNGIFNLEYVDWDLKKGNITANATNCNFTNGININGGVYELSSFSEFTITGGVYQAAINGGTFINCFFSNFLALELKGDFSQSIFDKLFINPDRSYFHSKHHKFNVFKNIDHGGRIWNAWNPNYPLLYPATLFQFEANGEETYFYKNSIISNEPNITYLLNTGGGEDIITLPDQYWGTTDSLKIREKIIDFWSNPFLPFFQFQPLLIQPSDSCHAHVWKVLLNGEDIQDGEPDPLGVGTHRFDVYFNRSMDMSISPKVSFGVRGPYNQQVVNENGAWSEDGMIYTVYKTVTLTTGDGLNRVRVSGAKEADGWEWEIPVEDQRFEFLIDAAGSASTAFMATPGLGKINLEWNDNDLEDGLGYNLYRMEHINDSTLTEPVIINPTLVLEPLYTDFEVIPGEKYYYYYKILRTNMAETDSSRVVSAIPHTASQGDANGDYNVDVLDIVTIVAFMLNNNPQPFIFEAADVNADQTINVLDIVGVNQLINSTKEFIPAGIVQHPDPAYISLDSDKIKVESSGQLTGLQFELHTAFPELVQLSAIVPGFELAWTRTDAGIFALLFSMQGKTIPSGLADIIRIEHSNPDLQWGQMLGASPSGQLVEILTSPLNLEEIIVLPVDFTLNVFPNPARDQVSISYFLPGAAEVQILFLDVLG